MTAAPTSSDPISLRSAVRALREELFDDLPDEDELERVEVTPVEADLPKAGSRPQIVLRDSRDRRYLFKVAPPEHIAAELFAYRVRSLGRRLHVPVARRRLEVPGTGFVTGLLQPLVPIAGCLPKDPRDWTDLQREMMLREHPWEWLLANLDTHIDQYVLLGRHGVPVNIDWDHSLVDLATTELTRFNQRSAAIAPVRNLLYSEYVQGRVEMDLAGQRWQVREARDLYEGEIGGLVQRYADELGMSVDERRALVRTVLARQRRIVRDFEALRRSLRHERHETEGKRPRRPLRQRIASRLRDLWQRFVVLVLHDHVVRPGLKAYRWLLSLIERSGGRPR